MLYCRIKSGTHVFEGVPQCLEEAEQQAEANVALVPGSVESLVHTDHILIIFIVMNHPLTVIYSMTQWWKKVA